MFRKIGGGFGAGLTTMTILRLGTIKMQSSRQVMKMLNGLQSVTVAERLWIGNGNWQKGRGMAAWNAPTNTNAIGELKAR